MNRDELERAFSVPRFSRFVAATAGDYAKGYELYKTNLRISSQLFANIAVFEVVFRNAIDAHYKVQFRDENTEGLGWLFAQSSPGGFLAKKGCEKSRASVLESIQKFGEAYSHDKAVANLGFAFWRNLFNAREFSAGGDSLLKIFQQKPRGLGLNQTFVFNKLNVVNDLRNRIAHHDPICFIPKTAAVSPEIPNRAQESMEELIDWLGFQSHQLLNPLDLKMD